MNMDEKENKIKKGNEEEVKENVLDEIKSGHIKMRPRWHFILGAVLAILGICIIGLVLLFLGSFILFSMRQTGSFFAPSFGFRGWFVFLRTIPWILVLLALLFVIVLEVLVRKYSFTYRKPLLYSVLALVALVLLGSFLFSLAPFHRQIFDFSRRHRGEGPPFVGEFYRGFGLTHFDDIHRGTVTDVGQNSFILQDLRDQTSTVLVSSTTELPPEGMPKKGNLVVVLGSEQKEGVIEAIGVHLINGENFGPSFGPELPAVPPETMVR